jgi:hypothetical protein
LFLILKMKEFNSGCCYNSQHIKRIQLSQGSSWPFLWTPHWLMEENIASVHRPCVSVAAEDSFPAQSL